MLSKTLLWAEWRQKRLLVTILGGINILAWLIIYAIGAITRNNRLQDTCTDSFLVLVLLVYSVVIAMNSFPELKNKTSSFLFSMAINGSKIFWIKYLFSAVILLFFNCINIALAYTTWSKVINEYAFTRQMTMTILLSLLIHVIVFVSQIFIKKYYLLLFPIILPISSIIAVPISITWYSTHQKILAGGCFLTSANILCFLISGWIIWKTCIITEKSPLKVILRTISVWLGICLICYAIPYGYARTKLTQAEREWKKVYPTNDYTIVKQQVPESLPDDQNAAAQLKKLVAPFRQGKNPPHCLSNIENGKASIDFYKWLQDFYDPKKGKKAEKIIFRALKCKYFKPDNRSPEDNIPEIFEGGSCWNSPKETMKIMLAKKLMLYQAFEAAASRNDHEFCRYLNAAEKLTQYYKQLNYPDNRFDITISHLTIMRFALFIGSLHKDMLPFYRRLFIESPKYDQRNNPIDYNISFNYAYKRSLLVIRWFAIPFLYVRTAEEIRLTLLEEKLLTKVPKLPFASIQKEYKRFQRLYWRCWYREWYNMGNRIFMYYKMKTKLNAFRLGLALKIYRIENGHFPDSLDKLPKSEIPLSPVTGKSFRYQRKGSGFTLHSPQKRGNKNEGYIHLVDAFKLEYQPFKTLLTTKK